MVFGSNPAVSRGRGRSEPRLAMVLLLLVLAGVGNTADARARPASVTVTEGTSFGVAASPDGNSVAFDLHGVIWVVSADGGKARRITDALFDARLPIWSPDGQTIAFQVYRGGNWHIATVGRDGRNLRQITHDDFDDREPAWAPDGRTLYFSSDRTRHYEIWKVDLASGALEQVTNDQANAFSVAVRADGALAYISRAFKRGTPTRIFVRAPGGKPEPVFELAKERVVGLSWMSQGQLSAMVYDSDWTAASTQLLRINPLNGAAEPLTGADEDVFPFRASTDHAGNFYYAADGAIKRRRMNGQVDVIRFAATLPISPRPRIARKHDLFDATTHRVLGIVHPVMSPDGKRIAFGALGDIWISDIGGKARRVTDDPFVDFDPAFSRDGKKLAYVSDRTGSAQIWIRDLASGSERLLPSAASPAMLAWSPDGKRIAFRDQALATLVAPAKLKIIDVETGALTDVEGLDGGSRPAWSPDGRRIAALTFSAVTSLYRESQNVITVVDLTSRARHEIKPPEGYVFGARDYMGPEWSPDGHAMAVIAGRGLWMLPVTPEGEPDGKPRLLAKDADGSMSWSAGQSLLYQDGVNLAKLDLKTGATVTADPDLDWTPAHPDDRILIRAGRIFDGIHDRYRNNVDVLVQGNRIVDLVPRDSLRARRFGGRLIDASDKTVMPGLIDAHAHVAGGDATALGLQWLSYGVTTVRSPGGDPYAALEIREAVASGRRLGPRLLFTGRPLDGSRLYYPAFDTIRSNADLEHDLRNAVALDYDFIKTYVRLPNDVQKKVIEFGARHGLYVTSHEFYPAAGLGVAGKEHLKGTSRDGFGSALSLRSRIYADVPAIIAATGIYITPTLALLVGQALDLHEHPERLSEARYSHFLTLAQQNYYRQSLQNYYPQSVEEMHRSVARLAEDARRIVSAGGVIISGTDCPLVACGLSLHTEIDMLNSRGGLTPFEALRTATSDSARMLGIGDQVGTLAPNMVADMIIIDGDPLARVSDTRNVVATVSNGRYLSAAALLGAYRTGR